MKDVQTVLEAYQAARAAGVACALATVVSVEGSAYRRPGARMLVYADGRRFGSLSGGCLEADVASHALQAIASETPKLLYYDPRRGNGDVILETGCKGAIGILVEPLTASDAAACMEFLASLMQRRQYGVIATVFAVEGTTDSRVGDRLFLGEDQRLSGALGGSPLAQAILEAHTTLEQNEKSKNVTLTHAESRVEVLVEVRVPPIALLLCGSGHDTVPLARIAAAMGWQVTIADPNGAALTTDRYADGQALLVVRPECLTSYLTPDRRTATVLMTHRYALDLDWFRNLLPTPISYLGLLGPRRRWLQMQRDLAAEGEVYSEQELSRVHSPAGLDIGSETPEEIALAIAAEINAVMNDRTGGFLRWRDVPIHSGSREALDSENLTYAQGASCPLSAS